MSEPQFRLFKFDVPASVDFAQHVSEVHGCYMLCTVEGCPRAREEGQDEACGLTKIVLPVPTNPAELERAEAFARQLQADCGANRTIDHWFEFIDGEMIDRPCNLRVPSAESAPQ
jgi:hypothetical protein